MPSMRSRPNRRRPRRPSGGSCATLLTMVTSWPRATKRRASSSERVPVALSRVAKYWWK